MMARRLGSISVRIGADAERFGETRRLTVQVEKQNKNKNRANRLHVRSFTRMDSTTHWLSTMGRSGQDRPMGHIDLPCPIPI